MEEIRRRDTQVFLKCLFSGTFWILAFTWVAFTVIVFTASGFAWLPLLAALAVFVTLQTFMAYRASVQRRFYDRRLLDQWAHCEDRVRRLRLSLADLRQSRVADLEELPKNVDRLASEIYVALRRADIVMHDLAKSEGTLAAPKPVTLTATPDKQAQELLRLADRNIAEYNSHMQRLLGTVQRTEAQAMVFITTLDTLRARMLNYRAAGRAADVDNHDFMTAIKEARMQFDSIDRALEELDAPIAAARSEVAASTGDGETLRSALVREPSQPPPVPAELTERLGAGPGDDGTGGED